MNNNFKCPKCGGEIEISDAFKHQIEESIKSDLNKKHQAELEEIKTRTEETLRLKIKEENASEISELKKVLQENEIKINEFRKNELELREKSRQLEDKEKNLELDIKRKLDEERKLVEAETAKRIMEDFQGQVSEKDKQISDMAKQIDDLRRISKQNSMQTQGEVGELEMEKILRELFPTDEISEVKKGELGGDIRQYVKTALGNNCGLIVWERKRTKSFLEEWFSKLKEDLHRDKAQIGVIVTDVLPKYFTKQIAEKSGIWVTTPQFIEPLARLLRKALYDVAKEKAIQNNKSSKAEEVYDYVMSGEFSMQIDRMMGIYVEMNTQIAKERVAAEKQWKIREESLKKLMTGTSGVFGTMQGIVGNSLQKAQSLELGDGTEN